MQVPFLLGRAGTSQAQRILILSLGLGVILVSGLILLLRIRHVPPTRTCFAAIDTAYLSNASLCLIVYAGAKGSLSSRSGWPVTMVIVWPMAIDLLRLLVQSLRAPSSGVAYTDSVRSSVQ